MQVLLGVLSAPLFVLGMLLLATMAPAPAHKPGLVLGLLLLLGALTCWLLLAFGVGR